MALKITGDAEATVGLVAVDKAVHILNCKHKFTQKKGRACGLRAKDFLEILAGASVSSPTKWVILVIAKIPGAWGQQRSWQVVRAQ